MPPVCIGLWREGDPMGELERNMRDDVGQPQGNAPSTDNGGQMDMFEDECERASLHRRGAITRGVAKRGLVAFLAFAMAFGTTPAQLWAEGAEGIAEAVAQAATPSEGTGAADGAVDGVVSETGSNASDASVNDGASTNAADSNGVASDDSAAVEASTASPDSSEQNVKSVVAASDELNLSLPSRKQRGLCTCSVVGTDAGGAQQTWAAAQQIALKEGSKVEVGDRLTIGRWNVVVIAG